MQTQAVVHRSTHAHTHKHTHMHTQREKEEKSYYGRETGEVNKFQGEGVTRDQGK